MGNENKEVIYEKEVIKMEWMTPEKAKKLLSRNFNNRPISMSAVRKFEKIIENNKWERVGDCITIDKYGNLLNGQHRLTAISRGTKSVQVDIKYGVSPEVRFYQNTGKTTTLSDKGVMFLTEIDLKKEMYSAICRTMNFFKNGGKFTTQKMDFNPKDVVEFAKQEPIFEILKDISKTRSNKKMDCFGNRTLAITKEILFRIVDEKKGKKFFDEICDISFLPGTATQACYKWLITRKNNGGRNEKYANNGETAFDNALNVAWEAWCKNKNIQKFYLKKRDKLIETKIYDPNNKLASFMN